jgi:hypothetical protein
LCNLKNCLLSSVPKVASFSLMDSMVFLRDPKGSYQGVREDSRGWVIYLGPCCAQVCCSCGFLYGWVPPTDEARLEFRNGSKGDSVVLQGSSVSRLSHPPKKLDQLLAVSHQAIFLFPLQRISDATMCYAHASSKSENELCAFSAIQARDQKERY